MNDDVAELARKIGEHRFSGYTDDMLADEIETFRSGRGVGGISEAVAALEDVADALAETDDTLRTELAKLGVEWHGAAGQSARDRLSEQADFSRSAGMAGTDSAQRLFAQSEAFNRTLHKLPDPAALRVKGDVGLGDTVLSLLGHETDAVRAAERKKDAREQAEQALKSYAQDSGEKLTGLPELSAPGLIGATVRPGADVPEATGAGGGSDDSTTAAHSTGSVPPGPAPSVPFTPGAAGTAPDITPPATGVAPGQAPARPGPGAVAGSPSTAPGATTPSGVTTPATSGGSPSGVGAAGPGGTPWPEDRSGAPGSRPGGQTAAPPAGQAPAQSSPAQQAGQARPAPGAGQVAPPGAGAGERAARVQTGVGGPGGVGAVPHTGVAPTPETPLAEGLTSGAVQPQPTAPPASAGSAAAGAGTAGGGLSADDVGGGAAALGAAGMAGALSGDDAQGRGVGRSAPGAARSPQELSVGDLPEEESRIRRSADRLGGADVDVGDAFLERAVPAGGTDDTDGADLFGDGRMVAPDLIGEYGTDGRP